MAEGFPGRLREVVGQIGSIQKLADASGISSRTISDYLSGESEPSRERLVALAEAGQVSVGWLATGREPIRSLEEATEAVREGVAGSMGFVGEARSLYPAPQPEEGERFVYVARYDIEASAGDGAEVHSEQVVDYLAFRRDWVTAQGLKPDDLALIEALGDSMEPTVMDGDLVLVDLSRREISRPGVYVLRRDSTLLTKRLELRWDAPGVVVRSDNPAYQDQVLSDAEAEQLQVLGRVVWLARRL
jgi:phage repressor protein C with HTH and peptisase S24 domain